MIITLTTDFGLRDHYVGSVKGVILSIHRLPRLVDITHDIPPQDIPSAAYVLKESYRCFPKGTIHLAVIDPGVGSDRKPIVVEGDGHLFVGPDNGIFSYVLRGTDAIVHEITNAKYILTAESPTFQGRDLFAPAAAWLSRGVPPTELGPVHSTPKVLAIVENRRDDAGKIMGKIVYIDHFGNLITSLTGDDLGKSPGAKLLGKDGIRIELRRCYADGAPEVPFALVNSSGHLEIFLSGGSARDRLRMKVGDPVYLET
jgi:S-adenosylmethionine hydrolase